MVTTNSHHFVPTGQDSRFGTLNLCTRSTHHRPRTLSIVHDWSCINMVDRPLRRTVWGERRAIFEHLTPQTVDTTNHPAGK